MDVRPVDPRDVRWEVDSPVYRVYFWSGPVRHVSTEFELSGAEDVHEVLAWAEANAPPDSTYTLYAVIEAGGEKGVVQLAGIDPTTPPV